MKTIDRRTRKWKTAVHEAGHAVAHVFLDLPNLRMVSIKSEGESLGRVLSLDTATFFPCHQSRRLFARKLALFSMAGGVLQSIACPGSDGQPSPGDLKSCMRAAKALGFDVEPSTADHDAVFHFWVTHPMVRDIERRLRWAWSGPFAKPAIAFAEILYQREEIDGSDARDMIREILGRNDEWQFSRWGREHRRLEGAAFFDLNGAAI